MKATFGVSLLGGMLAVSGGSYATDSTVHLKQVRGLVLVSQGNGFRNAGEGMGLEHGDRVMVMDGGAVALIYPNGCQAEYVGSQIVTVNAADCKGKNSKHLSPMYTAFGEEGMGAGHGAGAQGAAASAGSSAGSVGASGAAGSAASATGAASAAAGSAAAGGAAAAGGTMAAGTMAAGTIAGVSATTAAVVGGSVAVGTGVAVAANDSGGGNSDNKDPTSPD